MNLRAIIAAVIAALSFGGAWQLQAWRFEAKEKHRAEQELVNVKLSAATAIRRQDNVIEAQNAEKARLRSLRVDAAAARNELDSLRASADAALRAAGASQSACLDTGAKLKVVFLECSGRYAAVAEAADTWESSALTLKQAAPE